MLKYRKTRVVWCLGHYMNRNVYKNVDIKATISRSQPSQKQSFTIIYEIHCTAINERWAIFVYIFTSKKKRFLCLVDNVVDPEEEGCGDSGDGKQFVGRV